MKENKILENLNQWKFIILIMLIITSAFYWFQLRPTEIRKKCAQASEVITGDFSWNKEILRQRYNDCLSKHGLTK